MTTEQAPYKINKRPKHDIHDDEMKVIQDKKDRQIVMDAFERMEKRGSNTKEFVWEIMYKLHGNKQDEKEEKKENVNEKKKKDEIYKISQLTNKKLKNMCLYGHRCTSNIGSKIYMKDKQCIQCGSMKERKYCHDCNMLDRDQLVYCKECTVKNAENIVKKMSQDGYKANIIRQELINNPTLEMDLICNMQRKTALDAILSDINQLQFSSRSEWMLMALDLDNLKAWNSCIGHVAADNIIQAMGNILHKYVDEINNGKWNSEDKGFLDKAFVYRTGGDEFVMVLKTRTGAHYSLFKQFYESMKKSINDLGANIKEFVKDKKGNFDEKEWEEAMNKLDTAKDRNGQKLNMKIVGISTGLFIPDLYVKEKDWLSKADKIALEKAKTINVQQKNNIAIYYEGINDLIPNDKVSVCMEKGVQTGIKE